MRRCKHGKLKSPKGGRRCRKAPKRGGSSTKTCRYGKLKNPTGRRVCKKRPGGRRRR